MEEEATENIMVSICVMSYNLEKYIAEALDSILMQKVNFKYNIVVGEDYSTDNTRQILQTYVNKYPDKITLLLHEKNIGMLANFAATLKACHGKYIALLDGDDYWTDPLKLQKQVDFLEHNKDYSMTFHNMELQNETKNGVIVKPFRQDQNSREYTYDEIVKTWSVGTCSVLCINNKQYQYIEKNLWFPVQDLPFYLCCASKGKLYYMADTMSVYRRLLTGSQNSEKFKSLNINLDFIKYYKVLYNDFNDLLCKETIENKSALHYLSMAHKSRKKGDEKDYLRYLTLAMVQDPELIYEREIHATQKKLDTVTNKYNLIMKSTSNLIGVPVKTKPLRKLSAYKALTKAYFELIKAKN